MEVLLQNRVPILLDTNFWVMAREAAFGERDDPELISLLGALRMAVGSGKAFFPLTSDLIAEFSKQTPERLEATMMLVDQLSLGIVMIPHHERMAAEVEAFFARAYPGHPPERRPLWTSYAFALGYDDMRLPGVTLDDSMRVGLAETAWMMPPSVLAASQSPELFAAKHESERIAALLNEQEAIHAAEIDSHATAVRIEVAGSASMITGVAAREYRRIALAAGEHHDATDIPNSHRVTAITGLTDAHVAGHKLDVSAIEMFAAQAAIIIAHNAAFDRPFAERISPVFAAKPWACTMCDVPWKEEGIEGRRLSDLLSRFSYFFDAHRAVDDCNAGIALTTMTLPVSGRTVLDRLLEVARQPTWRIFAEGAPFETKEVLKQRGYRWNTDAAVGPRAWRIDVDEGRVETEITFLKTDILRSRSIPSVSEITAFQRYSARNR